MKYLLTLGCRNTLTGVMTTPTLVDFADKHKARRFANKIIRDTRPDKEAFCTIDNTAAKSNDTVVIYEAYGNSKYGVTIMIDEISKT